MWEADLEVPNVDKKGVHFCALCDGPLFRGRNTTLAVIGGSNMVGSEAMSLSMFADQVILIYSGEKLSMEGVMRKAVES